MLTRYLLLFLYATLFIQCIIPAAAAQMATTELTKATLPTSIKYKGKFIDAFQYKDTLGRNIIVRSETGIFRTKADVDSGTNSAGVYAYRYTLKDDSAMLAWSMIDFVKQCELDITANFVLNAFSVTDLDKDSIAEVWLVYQTSCRGDVSPNTMKIIMYEGDKKYRMTGLRKIQLSPSEVLGGKYKFDDSFLNGNAIFKNYAKELWKKNEANQDDPL
ncbi:MAG: hypothetical protein ABIN67_13445 [Ferruginibacter sp.]